MRLLRRSILNLFRSPVRTGVVVAILAVSLGLALTMFEVHAATASQLGSISGQIGTEIQVRPAGFFGFEGGGEPLPQEEIDKLETIAHVVSVQESTTANYTANYTGDSLVSAIEEGTLGRFGGAMVNGSTSVPGNSQNQQDMRMAIQVMGLDPDTQTPTLTGGGTISIVEGRYFTADEIDADVMVIGQSLAEKNSLQIGSTVDIEGTSVEIIGIYDSGQVFGNNMLVMPISTVQRLFSLDGATSVTVTADDVDNVDAVVTGIRQIFDEETADVTTAKDMYSRISGSVSNAGSSSQTGMIVAFVVAGVIILLSVVLTVRQRIREIGVLKAIGASNWQIGIQFGLETLIISLVASIVGACLTFLLAQNVAKLFVSGSAGQMGGGFGGGGMMFGGTIAGINVAVSPQVFLIALVTALVLAIAASTIPVWYIARVRPAEVLRNE
ncbi:MAG: FtsX-like permease family protein [Chloroflexi bacterium]|nr:FtsX-like permease family protein [Chloroflexota bacterium]